MGKAKRRTIEDIRHGKTLYHSYDLLISDGDDAGGERGSLAWQDERFRLIFFRADLDSDKLMRLAAGAFSQLCRWELLGKCPAWRWDRCVRVGTHDYRLRLVTSGDGYDAHIDHRGREILVVDGKPEDVVARAANATGQAWREWIASTLRLTLEAPARDPERVGRHRRGVVPPLTPFSTLRRPRRAVGRRVRFNGRQTNPVA